MPVSHASIFREYDIRGIVAETLFESDALSIGRAFARRAIEAAGAGAVVCIARDGRLSSPMLHAALAKGLSESGAQVLDLGLGPTPMLYFGTVTQKAAGGIMVTGSHNPPTHNGFKFMLGKKPFYGADIQGIRAMIEAQAFAGGKGSVTPRDIRAGYVQTLAAVLKHRRPLNVAWDAGNGAAGEVMELLVKQLPGSHHTLNGTIDGTFPAHHPDPTVPKNLEQLIALVKTNKLDLGIAFDGDGDRIGVVDDEGEILWGDQLLALLSRGVLAEKPGATIIADVKASAVLFDEIKRLGGSPLMWKTGHSLIKAKMQETGAPVAGEMSGHMFFADHYYGFDDALYAAVRVMSMVAGQGEKLSALRQALPRRVNTPEIRFDCPDERKFGIITEVAARLKQEGADVADVDGVRVTTPDGWWLLRASNTQAVLVARCEAADQAGLDRLSATVLAQLRKSGIMLDNLPLDSSH